MKVIIDQSFERDTRKLKDKKIKIKIADTIEEVISVKKLSDIPNCKKMKGSSNAYRIRMGEYRIGFFLQNNTVEFVRFLHRKDIYNVFP
ncbi:MAG: type II toxin-antitoxin system RelE/ParE family toxin [Brumimicrobium sp.]|nr:type II toxin-antitoxin system RelE/ParE family toxin [Brumimicrobium sp.]